MTARTAIAEAHWPADRPAVALLFREYQQYCAQLGYDLSFQGFESEVAGLPGKYAPPEGLLLIARRESAVAGCIAYRALQPELCEMKRLYVRPEFRGRQIGDLLCRELMEMARSRGYRRMRLDSGEGMRSARRLYEKLGFTTIAPYYANPYGDMVFLECALASLAR